MKVVVSKITHCEIIGESWCTAACIGYLLHREPWLLMVFYTWFLATVPSATLVSLFSWLLSYNPSLLITPGVSFLRPQSWVPQLGFQGSRIGYNPANWNQCPQPATGNFPPVNGCFTLVLCVFCSLPAMPSLMTPSHIMPISSPSACQNST